MRERERGMTICSIMSREYPFLITIFSSDLLRQRKRAEDGKNVCGFVAIIIREYIEITVTATTATALILIQQ